MTIFYADDDQDELDFFREALKLIDPSIECVTASNGREALQLLETIGTPGVIFLDLNMPGIDGEGCLVSIKNNARLKDVPVIIYSSTADTKDRYMLQAKGAFKVIKKIWGIAQLSREIHSVIVSAPSTAR
ncbi:response regulator [Fulvivirgaceae bacterium PWU4]|uniref:Response regulator n=1 Tax=Chryseosolibacter histidini TaxID=2782349 RepID=A0AAP2GNJ6_9BACT|nr:response regulator [Chryseosolibacter histidini]MBT1698093.1 response regulator [Chryseosolibacter histidini]